MAKPPKEDHSSKSDGACEEVKTLHNVPANENQKLVQQTVKIKGKNPLTLSHTVSHIIKNVQSNGEQ